jgi:hypothetical protein
MASRTTTSLAALLGLFVAIQLLRPARTNPPVDPGHTLQARAHVPAEVDAIFARACQDCHSNLTRWPWYSQVAPVSWLVASDVNEGRRHMNFSEWDPRASHHSGSLFDEICEQVRTGEMPLWFYLPLHPDARLSPGDVNTICAWTAAAAQGTAPR